MLDMTLDDKLGLVGKYDACDGSPARDFSHYLLRWNDEAPDFDSVPANIVFGEAFQAAIQSITAIDATIRIGEKLADQSGCILSLR